MDEGSRKAAGVQPWMCSKGSDSLAELRELKAGKVVT